MTGALPPRDPSAHDVLLKAARLLKDGVQGVPRVQTRCAAGCTLRQRGLVALGSHHKTRALYASPLALLKCANNGRSDNDVP